MAREDMIKKAEVFFILADAFNKATGKRVEVVVDTYVVFDAEGQVLSSTPDVNFMITTMIATVRDYLMEV